MRPPLAMSVLFVAASLALLLVGVREVSNELIWCGVGAAVVAAVLAVLRMRGLSRPE